MEFVIDTNVVMSILIKPKGSIYEVFLKIKNEHALYISDATLTELNLHHSKLLRLSNLPSAEFELLKSEVLQCCSIVATKFIPEEILINANRLTKKYDENDTVFIAAAIFINGLLWSLDKKLLTGLRRDGFMQIISTQELISTIGGL